MTAPRHTLDQLLILEAIAQEGSFAGAARRLCRVPSAVSYGVRTLEEAVGVSLFDRSGHRAALTEAGRRLLEEARGVLDGARRLDRLAQELEAGWEPRLEIVVDGALPTEPILDALQGFLARGLPTRVQLHVEYLGGVWERFEHPGADLALVLEGEERGAALPELPMVLVAAREHAASGVHERASLGEYVELVVRDSATRFRTQPQEAWFGGRHSVYVSDFHSKRLALLRGVGFGWMPRHLVAADLLAGSLVAVELGGEGCWMYRPRLVRRGDGSLGPAGAWMEELLVQSFGSIDGVGLDRSL